MSPEQIKAIYTSPDAKNNSTIRSAKAMLVLMGPSSWNMPYDSIIAQAENPAGAAPTITLEEVIASGLPSSTALNFYGRVHQSTVLPPFEQDNPDDVAPRGFNIQEDILLKNNTDNLNWFCKVYCLHNPNKTMADAEGAFEQLPALLGMAGKLANDLVTAAWQAAT